MNTIYLETWSTIVQVAAHEPNTMPIASFNDPVQALRQMYRQNADGDNIQLITNDGEFYWLVSATLAAKLYKSNFYPMLGASYLPDREVSQDHT